MAEEHKKLYEKIWDVVSFPGTAIFRIRDYKRVSQEYESQKNKNIELSGEVGMLNKRVESVSGIYDQEKARNEGYKLQIQEAQSQLEKYKQGILNSEEYTKLRTEKDRLESTLAENKGTLEDRDNLIKHHRADKKKLFDFARYLVQNKYAAPAIRAYEENSKPVVIIDAKDTKIIDYTKNFEKELDLKEDLRGHPYLSMVSGRENIEDLRLIKKSFSLGKEVEFDIPYRRDEEKISLHVKIKKPISIEVSLKELGKDRETKLVSCVPLEVEVIGKFGSFFHRKKSLAEAVGKAEGELAFGESENKKYRDLVKEYGNWAVKAGLKADKILDYERSIGKYGITKACAHLEKTISEIKKEVERKIYLEKRDEIISDLELIYGLKEKELIKIWRKSKENYEQFMAGCNKKVKEIDDEQEIIKVIGNIINAVNNQVNLVASTVHAARKNP